MKNYKTYQITLEYILQAKSWIHVFIYKNLLSDKIEKVKIIYTENI